MKTKRFLFYLLGAVLVGCGPVMSLHPLYNKEDVVFEKKLLGAWVGDSNTNKTTWEFKCPNEPQKAYELIFTDGEGQKGSFEVYLVKLDNKLFLDIYTALSPLEIAEPNSVKWPYNQFFFVPAHTFIKVDSVEPQLRMRLTNDEEMEKLLKEDPNAVKHELVEDRIILTASTKELQAFVLRYADDKRVFTEEIVLSRKKTKNPDKPDTADPNAIAPNEER